MPLDEVPSQYIQYLPWIFVDTIAPDFVQRLFQLPWWAGNRIPLRSQRSRSREVARHN